MKVPNPVKWVRKRLNSKSKESGILGPTNLVVQPVRVTCRSREKDPEQIVVKRNIEKYKVPKTYRHSMFEIIRQESLESNGYDSMDSLERFRACSIQDLRAGSACPGNNTYGGTPGNLPRTNSSNSLASQVSGISTGTSISQEIDSFLIGWCFSASHWQSNQIEESE